MVNNQSDAGLLLRLMPYADILRKAEASQVGGVSTLRFNEDAFKTIVRRFLRLIPFDGDAYLRANPDVADAVANGRYSDTPHRHFADHGFFEGRKPFMAFDGCGGGATDDEATLPDNYFRLVHKAQTSIGQGRWTDSCAVLRDILARYGRRPRVLRQLAYSHARSGAYRLAGDVYAELPPEGLPTDDLMTSDMTLRVNGRPDDALRSLEAARTLQARSSDRQALETRIAELRADLGDLAGALRVVRPLDRGVIGGAGTGLRHWLVGEIGQARERLKTMLSGRAQHARPTIAEQADLAMQLLLAGFPRIAARCLDRLTDMPDDHHSLSGQPLENLARATRVCRGPLAALKAVRQFTANSTGDPSVVCEAELLIATGRYAEALHRLATRPDCDLPDGRWFQIRFDAQIMLGQAAEALSTCRAWRDAHPGPHGWPAATLRLWFDQGTLSDTPIDAATTAPDTMIPRRIVQYWNDDAVPPDVLACMASWSRNNPGYDYERFSDESAASLLGRHCGADQQRAFLSCHHPSCVRTTLRWPICSRSADAMSMRMRRAFCRCEA
jgi:hypothetical protein